MTPKDKFHRNMVQRKLKFFGAKRKRTSTFGGRQKLLLNKLNRTFPARCAHRLVITPDQMLRKLAVEIFNAAEMLPVIEVPLIVSAASLHFSVVARHPWGIGLCFMPAFLSAVSKGHRMDL